MTDEAKSRPLPSALRSIAEIYAKEEREKQREQQRKAAHRLVGMAVSVLLHGWIAGRVAFSLAGVVRPYWVWCLAWYVAAATIYCPLAWLPKEQEAE